MTTTRRPAHEAPAVVGLWLIAVIVLVAGSLGSAALMFWQVEVSDDAVGEARTCGSAFDSVADRSGWEQWWAGDLGESDDMVRASLIRTKLCPTAINRRIAVAAALAGLTAIVAFIVRRQPRPGIKRDIKPGIKRDMAEGTVGGDVARLGTATALVGGALTVAGVIAITLLVADADSTLFLYVDRAVVGIVGLIVLMPPLALLVIGRVLWLVGGFLDGVDQEQEDA